MPPQGCIGELIGVENGTKGCGRVDAARKFLLEVSYLDESSRSKGG
jgi:hypothetical protein